MRPPALDPLDGREPPERRTGWTREAGRLEPCPLAQGRGPEHPVGGLTLEMVRLQDQQGAGMTGVARDLLTIGPDDHMPVRTQDLHLPADPLEGNAVAARLGGNERIAMHPTRDHNVNGSSSPGRGWSAHRSASQASRTEVPVTGQVRRSAGSLHHDLLLRQLGHERSVSGVDTEWREQNPLRANGWCATLNVPRAG
jgi:hypothetical protein